jgi:hypothetical protein
VRVVKEVLAQLKSEALKTGLEVIGNKTNHMRNLPKTKQDFNTEGQFLLNRLQCLNIQDSDNRKKLSL